MQTMEEYLLSQLDMPVITKDGKEIANPDGSAMTHQQAIAKAILTNAMKGDIKAAQYIQQLQAVAAVRKK